MTRGQDGGLGYPCPHCGKGGSSCIDSRRQQRTGYIRRRRFCLYCEARWTTVELPIEMVRGLPLLQRQLASMHQIIQELLGKHKTGAG